MNTNTNTAPLESSITKKILKWLNEQPNCYAEKTFGGSYGSAGKPDINGCFQGKAFQLEVKRPGGKATKLQKITLSKWREAGAIAEIVTSLDEVKNIIENIKHTIQTTESYRKRLEEIDIMLDSGNRE